MARGRAAALARAGDRRPAGAGRAGRGGRAAPRAAGAGPAAARSSSPGARRPTGRSWQALAALGRHSEALRQYQLASEALRAELGVAPGAGDRAPAGADPRPAAAPAPEPTAAEPAREPRRPSPRRRRRRADEPVGREVERRQIEGLLQGCRASGRGHVILIRGEAGHGQDHLPAAGAGPGARAPGSPPTWCRSATTAPAATSTSCAACWTRWTAAEHAAAGAPAGGATSCWATRSTRPRPALADGAGSRGPGAGARPGASRRWWRRPGARQPRVIAIEDLHWCDAETMRLLCALAGAAPQHRTVVDLHLPLGRGARRSAPGRRWCAGARSPPSISARWRADEAARLAARYPQRDAELARRCIERAAGHPLFLVQLLESGAAGDAVPQSVQAAVLARLAPGRARRSHGCWTPPRCWRRRSRSSRWRACWSRTPSRRPRWCSRAGCGRPGARLAIAHDLVAAAIRSALDGADAGPAAPPGGRLVRRRAIR